MSNTVGRVSKLALFQGDAEQKLIRGVMVFTFYAFSIQKWNAYTAQMLVPLISHSPVVFWLEPVFGVRGAGFFLGSTELIFGTLILMGYWNHKLGLLGALGSIITFIGTTSIVFFPARRLGQGGGWISDHDPANGGFC